MGIGFLAFFFYIVGLKRVFAILLVLLLASSWFASYFTLRLIDRVFIEHKLSAQELKRSREVVQSLGLSHNIHLKETDVVGKLRLGYAAPFIIFHENDYYEVLENPVNINIETNILQLVNISDSEKAGVAFIVNNLFQIYLFSPTEVELAKGHLSLDLKGALYYQRTYSNTLSVAVPPPKA